MKLIDKDALAAEIEKRKIPFKKDIEDGNYPTYLCALMDFEDLLDTLEVKEVDLEKEYEEYVIDDPIFGNFITNDTMGMKLAKHFYELGLKAKGE